jgi:hypothetical protein
MKVNPQHAMDVVTPGIYIYIYIYIYRERERERVCVCLLNDGEWRSVSWVDVVARGRVPVEETEVISVGLVDPEKRRAERGRKKLEEELEHWRR